MVLVPPHRRVGDDVGNQARLVRPGTGGERRAAVKSRRRPVVLPQPARQDAGQQQIGWEVGYSSLHPSNLQDATRHR